jgi:hypothetical protein
VAFSEEIIITIRYMINDLADTPTYSDARLEQLAYIAAQHVNAEVSLTTDYTISMSDFTISPDPSTADPRDDAFMMLIAVKSACIISQGEAIKSAGQSIAIKDGSSSIDLRGAGATKLALLDKGWCKNYEQLKFDYQTGALGEFYTRGREILAPFNYYNLTRNNLEFR